MGLFSETTPYVFWIPALKRVLVCRGQTKTEPGVSLKNGTFSERTKQSFLKKWLRYCYYLIFCQEVLKKEGLSNLANIPVFLGRSSIFECPSRRGGRGFSRPWPAGLKNREILQENGTFKERFLLSFSFVQNSISKTEFGFSVARSNGDPR